jgi:hypothetical protein
MSRLLRERFDADAVIKRTTQSRNLRNSFGTLGATRREQRVAGDEEKEEKGGGKDHYALSLSLSLSWLFISVKSGVRARTFARPIRRRDGSPEISIVKVLRLLLFAALNSPIRHFADKCESGERERNSPLTDVRDEQRWLRQAATVRRFASQPRRSSRRNAIVT